MIQSIQSIFTENEAIHAKRLNRVDRYPYVQVCVLVGNGWWHDTAVVKFSWNFDVTFARRLGVPIGLRCTMGPKPELARHLEFR